VTDTIDTKATTAAAVLAGTAGARLKAAREAAGLSVDAVAQQLKLAPRQVKALEEDDWQRLPGRTFVRGFTRNYARFVQLDPDTVLSLMPGPDTAPALERPALAASRRPMGEIPVDRVAKPSAVRWLLPLLLVLLAIVAVAAYYPLSRSQFHLPAILSPPADSSAPVPATAEAPVAAPPASPGTATSVLPNPIPDAATAPAAAPSETKDAASAGSATAAVPTATAVAPTPAPDASGTAPEAPLVLTFKGTSWAEVKDAKGRVVLQMTGGPGMAQTVSAVPPLELSLGNAAEVGVTFRGQSLDLSPYTRGGVARVALK
jgi:cytoskeleton protein RodZ